MLLRLLFGTILFVVVVRAVHDSEVTMNVLHSHPHDRFAFTQGFEYSQGFFWESTGLIGRSSLRQVNVTTGEVKKRFDFTGENEVFGEGMTLIRNELIYMISWHNGRGFVFNQSSFELMREWQYEGEGWGLAYNEDTNEVWMSDGTPELRVLQIDTMAVKRTIRVSHQGHGVVNINELEWVCGELWANIWKSSTIVRIDPETGVVKGKNEAPNLPLKGDGTAEDNVQNGIAFDKETGRLWLTGKLWAKIYEVRVNGLELNLTQCADRENSQLFYVRSRILRGMQRSKCSPVQSIAGLEGCGRPRVLLTVLLGIDGPRVVTKKNGEQTVVSTLVLADESYPMGVELSVWGINTERLAHLKPMSVLHVPCASVRKSERPEFSLSSETPQHITLLRTCSSCDASLIADALRLWHKEFYGALLNVKWCSVVPLEHRFGTSESRNETHSVYHLEQPLFPEDIESEISRRESVKLVRGRLKKVRVRISDQSLDIVRALQRAVIKQCGACGSRTGCHCPLAESKYGLDEKCIAVRVEFGDLVAHCAGDDLARLLLVEPEELCDVSVARRAAYVLSALAVDKTDFQVAFEWVPGESIPRLRELRF